MLLRHASGYFAANVVQALAGLVLLAALTRVLGPEEYGRYALALAIVQIGGGPLFHWCRAPVTRFLVAADLAGTRARLLTTVRLGIVMAALAAAAALALAAAAWPITPAFRPMLWALLPAAVAQAAFQLRTEVHRASLRLRRCAGMLAGQAVLAAGLSLALAGPGGWSSAGAVWGGTLAAMATLLLDRAEPLALAPPLPWREIRPMLGYSLPLTAILALDTALQSGDRLVVAGLLGTQALGAYAAPQSLAMRSVANLCAATGGSSLPIVIATLERHGAARARAALRQSGELMLALAIPCTAALVALAGPLTDVVIGPALRHEARILLPLIAVGTLLNGVTSHYVAHGFLLARQTRAAVIAIVPPAAVGIGLNLVLVPWLGVVAAGIALLAAQGTYLALSLWLVARWFRVPISSGPVLVLLLCCLVGMLAVAALPLPGGLAGLLGGGAVMAAASAAGVLASGIAGIRDAVRRRAFA